MFPSTRKIGTSLFCFAFGILAVVANSSLAFAATGTSPAGGTTTTTSTSTDFFNVVPATKYQVPSVLTTQALNDIFVTGKGPYDQSTMQDKIFPYPLTVGGVKGAPLYNGCYNQKNVRLADLDMDNSCRSTIAANPNQPIYRLFIGYKLSCPANPTASGTCDDTEMSMNCQYTQVNQGSGVFDTTQNTQRMCSSGTGIVRKAKGSTTSTPSFTGCSPGMDGTTYPSCTPCASGTFNPTYDPNLVGCTPCAGNKTIPHAVGTITFGTPSTGAVDVDQCFVTGTLTCDTGYHSSLNGQSCDQDPPPCTVAMAIVPTSPQYAGFSNGSIAASASSTNPITSVVMTSPSNPGTGGNPNTFSNLSAGAYSITATDTICSYTTTINLPDGAPSPAPPPPPVVAPSIAFGGSPFAFTVGNSVGSITPSNSGDPITSCSISPALPAGLSFNTSNCAISGTPTVASGASSYTITASNAGGSGSATISISVVFATTAPIISYSGSPYTFTMGSAIATQTPSNSGGAITSCSISPALPSGLSFNSGTCDISGTPTITSGTTSFTVTASNAGGNGATTISISVSAATVAPVIAFSGGASTFTAGVAIAAKTPTNTGSPITSCSIAPVLPAGLSFNSSTCTISGTPTATSPATTYTVTASNAGGSGSTTLSIGVVAATIAPVIAYAGSPFSFTNGSAIAPRTPTNSGGAITSCSVSPSMPSGLSFNTSTCTISGTPTVNQGSTSYTVTATNAGGSGVAIVSIAVVTGTVAPIIAYGGSPFSFTAGTSVGSQSPFNSGSAITSCSVSPSLPAGLSLNTSNCTISGTPTTVQGSASYTVTATNSAGSGSTSISISVSAATLPPIIAYSGSPYTFTAGSAISSKTPSNSGGAISSCSISPSLPAGLSFNTSTCTISGTPSSTQGLTTYSITASNGGGSGSTSIGITVIAATLPPVIAYSGSPYTFTNGTAISSKTPSNSGGAISSCSIAPGLPAGLSFNVSTCTISGTPSANSGATTYTVTATNAGGSGSTSISITVVAATIPPAIAYGGSPFSFTAGTAIAAQTPSNTGGAITSCSVSPGIPSGLSFNTSTCAISGTPSSAQGSTSYTVTATNAGGSGSTTISITVAAAIAPPIIAYSGSPYTFTTGTAIASQTPSNSGGAIVSCSISPGLPAGLSFNTSTCTISGTPSSAQSATSYTITANNTGGSGSTTISIKVNSPAPTMVLTVTGTHNIWSSAGGWISVSASNVSGSATATISPSIGSKTSPTTNVWVFNGLTSATTYTISVTDSLGTVTTSASLSVQTICQNLCGGSGVFLVDAGDYGAKRAAFPSSGAVRFDGTAVSTCSWGKADGTTFGSPYVVCGTTGTAAGSCLTTKGASPSEQTWWLGSTCVSTPTAYGCKCADSSW